MPRRLLEEFTEGQVLLAVTPETSVQEAARAMASRFVGAVPVLDGDTLCGIFTERDLLLRVVAAGRDPEKTRVAEVMSRDPVTVDAGQDAAEAMRAMVEFNVRHIVVRGRSGPTPYGIVSVRDFFGTELAAHERELEFQERVWERAW